MGKEFLEQYFVTIYQDNIESPKVSNIINQTLVYYVKKARFYKKAFYILSITVITFNCSIPIISQFQFTNGSIMVTILSSIATVSSSVAMLFGTKDLWGRYRVLAELLKNECLKFNAKVCPYCDPNHATEAFIITFQQLQQSDRTGWQNFRKQNNDISTILLDEGNNS